MVFTNGFLITQVIPANNESHVALDANVRVAFSMDMEPSSITSGTVMLNEVNFDAVPATVTYDRDIRTATIKPGAPLQPNISYEIIVQGGPNGVRTVTGTTLPANMTYIFSTTEDSYISIPSGLDVDASGVLPVISWVQPDSFDSSKQLYYAVAVSTSALDPDADPGSVAWPHMDDYIANVTGTSIRVSRILPDNNYYAYVRAYTDTTKSGWISKQFILDKAAPGASSPTPSPSFSLFEVSATYPKANAVNIEPDSVKILFTSDLDAATVTNQTVYIVKAKMRGALNAIDYMTEFAPARSIPFTLDPVTANVVSLSGLTIEDNTHYTVVVREDLKSKAGDVLGEAYSWIFTSVLTPLFGDPDKVRSDISNYLSDTPDDTLYEYMHDISVYAYGIVSLAPGFDVAKFKPTNELDQYVRFKTSYDLLINAYVELTATGKATTTLGELSISREANPADISAILEELKLRIKPWEDAVHGLHNRGYAKPNRVRKGETDQYPWSSRTTYKDFGR